MPSAIRVLQITSQAGRLRQAAGMSSGWARFMPAFEDGQDVDKYSKGL
jgi:hypothetical protein